MTTAHAAGTVSLDDLMVHRMGFGAMRVTGEGIWGDPPDRGAAKGLLRRVVELGVDFLDTADSYGPDVSEELIAEALHPYPDGLVIGTKAGLTRPGPGRWVPDCRPERLKRCCEGSLRRLKLDRIDLFQLHTSGDRDVPFSDSVGALAELREEGKVRHVGLSNVEPEHLEIARDIVPVVSVQNRYSLADRASDAVVDICEREGMAFIPWFPLAVGELAAPDGPLAGIARDRGATPAQVALAWLLHRSPAMLPIPGTSSVEHLEENVGAAALELSAEDMEAIEEAAG